MTDRESVPLLHRRLIFVIGKGGVGRSTVAASFGLLSARRGARTIVAEVSGRGELPELFGRDPQAGEVEMTGRLSAIQIDPERALDEYLHEHLPLRMLADLVGATRLIGYLAAATPGLRELLSVGKLWELAQPERRIPDASPYDLVIVDAPASGHSLALLSAPQAFARAAQGGPVARQGQKIDAMLHDRSQTALVAVARAEEAAVSELIELRAKLRSELALELDALIVNALPAAALRGEDADALRSALDGASELEAGARSAIERVLGEDRDAHAARTQVERLARELPDTPLIELPRCAGAEVGFSELEALSDRLAVVL